MFYYFSQNNSGGYFVQDEANGVGEYVVVEAKDAKSAYKKLEDIGDKVDGFWSYCECCGDRWYDSNDDDDGEDFPHIYGEKFGEGKVYSDSTVYVHYENGKIEKVELKRN